MGQSLGFQEAARDLIEESVSIARALHYERRAALALSLLRNSCASFLLRIIEGGLTANRSRR
jgi:hypothetical protein